jgi:hypoxanthine phosphoribosyltransferase
MPLLLDFIHATRRRRHRGRRYTFRSRPVESPGRTCWWSRIFDVGVTMQNIVQYCLAQGARSVRSAVLVRKIHERETIGEAPDFIGMDVADHYIFGCGMDAYEHWRHLDEIRALEPGQ